ncbi:MAG: transporter substrate-binding domain-containing protein [Tannerellaceae bacterium]|nr:transporter substrate-binding domain-containing protein [Tannerellaceae bacterium]
MKSKKLLFLYPALLIVVMVTMYMLRPASTLPTAERDYPEIREEGILRIVTEYNQSGYYISGEAIEGFQYELSQAIARLSGLEVQIGLEMSLEESFTKLNRNEYDIIARNIPVTTEMRESWLFTEPMLLNRQVLVQRKAEVNEQIPPIRNQIELGGKTLYIPKGSPALLRLHNLAEEIGDTIRIIEEERYSTEQLLIRVARSEIDYAVCDLYITQRYLEQFPELDIRTDISFTQLQSWALRKTSPVLLDSLNSWLVKIKETGVYEQIYKRYYTPKD